METIGGSERSSESPDIWQNNILPNLGLVLAMLAAGVVNFILHVRFAEMSAWLPSGIAAGAVLLHGMRILPGVFLGAFLLMLGVSGQLAHAFLYALVITLSCQAVATLLSLRKACHPGIKRVGGVAWLLFAGMTVFLLASALLGPRHAVLLQHQAHQAIQHESGQHEAGPPARSGTGHSSHAATHGVSPSTTDGEWLFSEVLGVLFMAPVLLWLGDFKKRPDAWLDPDWRGATLVFLVLVAVAVLVYSGFLEDRFGIVHTTLLVLPPAVCLALEYGAGYTILGNLLVFFIVGMGTSLGYGPFKDHSTGLPLLTVVYCLTTLLIAASRAERQAAEATIHRLATKDALTGLPNRTLFAGHVERALYNAKRYRKSVAIMFIDLDYFKKVNDTLGHDIGDLVLVEAAARIQSSLRVDSMLARFGGDEFVALVDNVEDREALRLVAQRIALSLAEPFNIKGHLCHISCSVGVSFYPEDGDSLGELLKRADIAMYEVKMTGRNGIKFFTSSMHQYLDGGR